jgi:hypothetical protein
MWKDGRRLSTRSRMTRARQLKARIPLCLWLLASWVPAADVFSWYPLQVGRRWVYDCVSKGGDPRKPDVWRWTALITIKGHLATKEGLVILRSVRLQGTPNPPAGWAWQRGPLLVRGACVYPLYGEAWDEQTRSFKPGFDAYIRQISPAFCFPLETGAGWKGDGDWPWIVEGRGASDGNPQDVPADAFRLRSQQSGSTEWVWFQKGVGPVAWRSWHNGTYTEGLSTLHKQLLDVHAAAAAGDSRIPTAAIRQPYPLAHTRLPPQPFPKQSSPASPRQKKTQVWLKRCLAGEGNERSVCEPTAQAKSGRSGKCKGKPLPADWGAVARDRQGKIAKNFPGSGHSSRSGAAVGFNQSGQ